MLRPAVFLDRDGTIIRQVHYIRRTSRVELLPGAGEAIGALRRAGYACVVISNQTGVGRGILSDQTMRAVQAEVEHQLALAGARLDGAYFCTFAPPANAGRSNIDHPDRKPGPGMLLTAACDLGLDLARSWMVGDLLSDILAGRNAGVRSTIHVQSPHPDSNAEVVAAADHSVPDLAEAARLILATA